MIALWWTLAAYGATPDRVVEHFDVGTGEIERLAVSDDGTLVAGVSGSKGYLAVINVEDWSTTTWDECGVGAVTFRETDDGPDLFVACGDGTMRVLEWRDEVLSDSLDSDGAAIQWTVASKNLLGAWYDAQTDTVYATGRDDTDDVVKIYSVDPEDGPSSTVVTLVYDDYNEAVLSNRVLYVSHSGNDMSNYSLGSSAATISQLSSVTLEAGDLTPRVGGGAYVIDTKHDRVLEYLTSYQFQITAFDLTAPQAMVTHYVGDGENDYALVIDDDRAEIYGYSSGGALQAGTIVDSFELGLDGTAIDAVAIDEGYAFVSGSSGRVAVLSTNPWITITPIDAEASEGDTVTLTFEVDESGDWELIRGGDRTGSGVTLASGSAAPGEVTTSFEVTSAFAEGTNHLYVLHTDTHGNVGHARTSLTVDNPPDAPTLTEASVSYSDGALKLSFDALSDEDLARYDVYVTVTPFDGDDYADGGPDFDGDDDLETPISVDASDSATVTATISPLTNETTYYIGVRAIDEGGLVSPMSNVVQGVPHEAFTAASLAGEEGGHGCRTAGGSFGWIGLLGVLGLARRRRSAPVAALGALLVLSTEAEAGNRFARDLTPAWGDVEVRYGWIDLQSTLLEDVYGTSGHDILQVEGGLQLFRYAEIDVGAGLLQDLAYKIDDSGVASGDRTMMTWVPLSLDLQGRAHIWDEQILVPYGRIGFDYLLWQELSDDGTGGKDKVGGGKFAWHYGFGGSLLLDWMAPRRAGILEAQTGINDTYLTVDVRWQRMLSKGGLDFSGRIITIGLKVDY